MSSDKVTYSFCIESLRYIHTIIGYDAIIKELDFIEHLSKIRSVTDTDKTNSDESNTVIIPKEDIVEKIETTKHITISDASNNKYVRSVIPDEIRCEALKNDGSRCTLKKCVKEGKFCSRHTTQ
jgi:pyruvate kinase